MARFGIVGEQYFDDNGDPLSGGKLYFYEPSTTTDKPTYSDSGETTANAQPVVLDAAGRQGDIFFSGQAKVVLKTSADVDVDTIDPYGSATSTSAFATWSSSETYSKDDLVRGSDDNYYLSITNSNTGNNPTSSPTNWMQVRLLSDYNANYAYDIGDVVLSSNLLYVSLTGSNTGNTPATNPSNWRALGGGLTLNDTAQTANFTATAGNRYLIDTSGGAITMTLPASPAVGDVVGFLDYTASWSTNALTIGRNSQEIMNLTEDMTCSIDNYSGALQFTTDRGWVLL